MNRSFASSPLFPLLQNVSCHNFYTNFLKSCIKLKDLRKGQAAHAHFIKSTQPTSTYLLNHLIILYSKCNLLSLARRTYERIPKPNIFSWNTMLAAYGKVQHVVAARKVFDEMPERDVISWNTLLACYSDVGNSAEVFSIFSRMLEEKIDMDGFTFSTAVSGCSMISQANTFHALVIHCGAGVYASVNNALITVYSNHECLDDAFRIFKSMDAKDEVSFNAMIVAYGQHKRGQEAMELFQEMVLRDLDVDVYSLASVLTAFTGSKDLQGGKCFHARMIRSGWNRNSHIGSGLIDLYSKCGIIVDADRAFGDVVEPDLVLWNTMISGLSLNEMYEHSVTCFSTMRRYGLQPDDCSFVCVLSASASLSIPLPGKQIHSLVIRSEFHDHISVNNALITMYAKCGGLADARRLFNRMQKHNSVSCNAMISGYAQHGCGVEALGLFEEMLKSEISPTSLTFISVLAACGHTGRVDEGTSYFNAMKRDYGIEPDAQHYSCMIDLLGRAGWLDDAEKLIHAMPFEPTGVTWAALLGACRVHRNVDLAAKSANELLKLEPWNAAAYVILFNVYAEAGRLDEAARVRRIMRDKGIKKNPGCSWIELRKHVHVFVADDTSHASSREVYGFLEEMSRKMDLAGYVPEMPRSVLLRESDDMEMTVKLGYHSEKLAVAFGVISTEAGVPLLVVKNLRICGDCHAFMKFISKVVRREITVRDTYRFHCFSDGRCSCGDYW